MKYAIEPQTLMMTTNREAHRAAQAGPALQPAAFPTLELALSFIPIIPPTPTRHTAPLRARQQAYTGNTATLLQARIILVSYLVCCATQRKHCCRGIVPALLIQSLHIGVKSCYHLRLAVGITGICHAVSTAIQLWPLFLQFRQPATASYHLQRHRHHFPLSSSRLSHCLFCLTSKLCA